MNDKLRWPIPEAVVIVKSYRVRLRKLWGFNENNDILYMDCNNKYDAEIVQDNMNVETSYRILKDKNIQHICSLHGKVDV